MTTMHTTLTRWHRLQQLTDYELKHGRLYRARTLAGKLSEYHGAVPAQRRTPVGE